MNLKNSTPSFHEFDPQIIKFQAKVINDIFRRFDYSKGAHEVLLSGSVGSAKSILMAHIILRLAMVYPHANIMIGRRALPDLKETLYRKILEHMEGSFLPDVHYHAVDSTAHIDFSNRSNILSRSWADKRYFKLRSLELTAAFFEELTENEEEDAYVETTMRVGRTPHVPIKVIVSATNPGPPSHWAYKRFIEPNSGGAKHPTRHVYYSRTEENPFLPVEYIESLKANLDPKMARRMLYGEWIEIAGEVIYYAYNSDINYRRRKYEIVKDLPIHIMFDFNIGDGKPMSCAVGQYYRSSDDWHIFDEVVIEGARTSQILEELDAKGYLKPEIRININGDAAGKNRDTRNSKSDYDIIFHELSKRGVNYEYRVPASNPALRSRHNTVNAYCCNDLGRSRLFIYEKAETAHKGFRLTKLKKGTSYIEDDSKHYQHITTAIGYGIMFEKAIRDRKPQGSVEL